MAPNVVDEENAEARLHRVRHSAAHILADAIMSFYPEAKLAIGPPTKDGFYYDVDLPHPLSSDDLDKIETRMREVIVADHPFEYAELTRSQAKRMFAENPYKIELIDALPSEEKITTYAHGSFTDLCDGPHVDRTSRITAIKLLSVAGAYWRGDEQNPMLQRIYGTAFETQEEMDEHLDMIQEALNRDHRKIGRELDLFMFDPIAPASPFFLPKGAIVYNLLMGHIRGLHNKYQYQEVVTPLIFSSDLWRKSGHYEHYRDNMFFSQIDDREFGLKPMNCPAHAQLFASVLRSYRDLPVRFADFGRLHRYERSGVTHGLTRVRSLTQDDGHIFCRLDQVEEEIGIFFEMVEETYSLFGFSEPEICLSLRPDKRVGSDEAWTRAESILKDVLQKRHITHSPMPGEGAFYGPKIDFFVKDALGRDWQLSTLQLDFSLPERFNLEFVTEDDHRERPVVIHRAVLGTLERFMGILLEHTAGALPVWLSPIQAKVIPIADRHNAYAKQISAALSLEGLRAEIDSRNERMNFKIRDGQVQKIPYLLIVGDREERDGTVSVRERSGEDRGAVELQTLIDNLNEQNLSKS